jgi:AraC-like DNA-binding protein
MSDRPDKWRASGPDAMMSLVDVLRVRGRVYCRTEMAAPWGIAFPRGTIAHFHAIEKGPCWLRVDGARNAVQLAAGDLVLLPHGNGHTLADSPRSRTVRIDQLVDQNQTPHRHAVIRGGGKGPTTRFVCGQFSFEEALRHPLIAQLPPLLHIKGDEGRSHPWLKRTLQFLADETRRVRPGTATIVSRLTDIVFVQALRAWIDGRHAGQAVWLRALRDRRIGAALDRMHQSPERIWTIATLAAEIGMSRSPFAARFTKLIGEPPLTYLTRWRMLTASTWLETSDLGLAEIAERTGYRSEAAFTKAFKRHVGVSPSVVRRRATAGTEGPRRSPAKR